VPILYMLGEDRITAAVDTLFEGFYWVGYPSGLGSVR